MNSETKKSLAESLETDINLLPYMPWLLQDLWELGSSVELILESIKELDLAPHSHVLDLGCGKGAVSIKIAAQFGFDVVGIDAMEEFLQVARIKSEEWYVTDRCQFIKQDMRDYVKTPHNFDIVILASIGGIFGTWKDTIATLRTQVKSGGYIIIDDGYLKSKKSLRRKGYSHYCNYNNSVAALTQFGDVIFAEKDTSELSSSINNQYIKDIKIRGQEFIQKYPHLEKKLKEYIQNQYEECDVLEKEINGVLWVIQKRE